MKTYKNNELKQVQKIEKNILDEVVKICEEENIMYFLLGGTALGAKRHGGFIPWDDDLDIGMVRNDYERFLSVANDKLPDWLFLQSYPYDKKSPYIFTKICDKNSRFIEYCSKKLNIVDGIFIDIFPLDIIPSDIKKPEKYCKKIIFLWRLYCIHQMPNALHTPNTITGQMKNNLRIIFRLLLKLIPKKIFFSYITKQMSKYKNEIPNQLFEADNDIDHCVYSYDLFFPPSKLTFENDEYYVPGNIDQYLTEVYGNYMELPPENERNGHSPLILEVFNDK